MRAPKRLTEAHWAFGCIEVGYSAEFTDNPSLKEEAPPLAESDKTEGVESKREEAEEPDEAAYPKIISDEWFWTRRIPPRQVIVSSPESAIVEELDWVGYWEYQHLMDVKKAPAYSNTQDLKAGSDEEKKDGDTDTSADDVKLYKIWDQRTKTRSVFAEGHDKPLN